MNSISKAQSKNIVLLSAFYDPFMSGAEQMVKEVAERLGSQHKITIITARLDRRLLKEENRLNYRLIRVGIGNKHIDKILYPILAAWRVRRLKPNITHAVMESYAGIALWFVKYIYPRAYRILTLQSGDLDSPGKQKMILIKFFWRKIHSAPEHITAISNYLAGRAKRLGVSKEKISVIPNGVDLSKIPTNKEKIKGRVICVARLSWEKGLDYLLRAWPKVLSVYGQSKLVLIGEGVERANLEKLVNELKISESVEFKGSLPHEKVLEEIRRAEVFICPSLAEGLGNVFIEAQACGTAVIGTKVGGIPDIIINEENGLLIEPRNEEEISKTIIKMLENANLRSELENNAKETVRRFDWNNIVENIGKIYLSKQKIKLLIATGIYPPDIGGPATFAKFLHEGLMASGVESQVVSFTNNKQDEANGSVYKLSRHHNVMVRYLKYFWLIYKMSQDCNFIYAFDLVSVGLPCALVKILKPGKKFIIRLGGDYLWEQAVQRKYTSETLEEYYKDKKFSFWERMVYSLNEMVLNKCDLIIFNAFLIKDIFVKYRGVEESKSIVIKNIQEVDALPAEHRIDNKSHYTVVYAGRLVEFKNVSRLIQAVSGLVGEDIKVVLDIIGEGPSKRSLVAMCKKQEIDFVKFAPKLGRSELLEKLSKCDVTACVSLTEVNSNTIGEAFLMGKTIILTKYSEFNYIGLNDQRVYTVDPYNVEEIKRCLRSALNEKEVPGDDDKHISTIRQAARQGMLGKATEVIGLHEENFNKLLCV